MNALEKAQLRIQPEDRIPTYPERGEWYHVSWASPKFKRMRVELLSIRGDKVVVRTTKGKILVTNTKDLRNQEHIAIENAKKRIRNNNKRRQLNI
jgi:formylmethanofuran dehydrogenase subunit D